MKILYTANELSTRNLKAVPPFAAQEIEMRQLDEATPQRFAANEHLRDTDTRSQASIASEPASDFQGRVAQVVRAHDTLTAQLNQAAQALERAQQNYAAAATRAAQHLTQQETELAAAKAEAATLRESLERQLANATARAADADAAAERLARREAEVAEAVEGHQKLERRFSAAIVLLQEQDGALDAAKQRLTRREAELAEATEARLSLEKQVAAAESALGEAVRRAADDRSTAIEQATRRQSEFEALLREEVAKYDTLTRDLIATRQELAHANTMLQEAEARHASAIATTAAERHELEARHETRLAEAIAARVAVSRQLHEITTTLDRARQDHLNAATTAGERFAEQEVKLHEETAARQMLEGQLADTHIALQAAEQRAAAERLAASQRADERDAEFAARLDREAATRETLEQALNVARSKVAETETALRDAEHRHASHISTVTARFADQQVQYETRLAEAASARDLVDQRIREVEVSFEQSRQDAATDAAAAAARHAQLEAERADILANLQLREGQLADAIAALHVAEQGAATERLSAERQAAQRRAEFEATIARETDGRRAVEQDLATSQQKLAESESSLRDAEQRHASEMKTAAGQFAERQRELETLSAQIAAARDASDLRLREAEATLERIHDERRAEAIAVAAQRTQLEAELAKATALVVSERAASAERANARQLEFDARLSLELETRNANEQALAATRRDLLQTEAALRDALARHTEEMTSASNQLSAQHSQYTTRLAQASAAHAALEQQLADADQRHASALNAAATQLTEQQRTYETRLAEVTSAREIVSQQLHDAETTLARVRQESDAKALAASERISQRESELAGAAAARQALEDRLVDTETALKHAEAQALAERAAATQQAAQRQAEFDAQLAREVEARNVVLRDLGETRMAAEQTQQALLGQAAALTAQMREIEARLTQELALACADYEGKLAELSRVHRDATENFERIRQANEIELVRIHALVAERDGQVKDQAARLEQLQSDLKAVRQEFEQTRRHRDRLQIEADRVPLLTNQIEASRAESRRQFDGSPIGILRCSDAGVLKEANRALLAALGYRSVDQLRPLGSPASVFESPDDFRWLIRHCEGTPSEWVDCIWKKKDGSRLTMRVCALRLSADVVEIVAEDLTALRAAEERLRQAQRMEAVGRLASEVADTCDILLRNVSQDGQQWLANVGSNTVQRQQGELIFGEVTRAAGFLKQLSVFGEKQTRALGGVDVHKLWRELTPVLKRVAGGDIEFVLPRKIFALHVDVDAERVERVLVNIAAYARERMPSGGRVIIQLARVVVDLDFVTKYPNVRPGAHALISVTEVRTAAPAEWPTGNRELVAAAAIATAAQRPGVDLVAFHALIGDCGGHLWMNVQPGGDMELKIHLPLRAADTSRSAGIFRSARGRLASSWFQS